MILHGYLFLKQVTRERKIKRKDRRTEDTFTVRRSGRSGSAEAESVIDLFGLRNISSISAMIDSRYGWPNLDTHAVVQTRTLFGDFLRFIQAGYV
jgi:hypothetical protein